MSHPCGARSLFVCALASIVASAVAGIARAAAPTPIGPGTMTISYQTTNSGMVSFSADRSFLPNAAGPGDATVVPGAANMRAFNSIDSFGRRTFLEGSNPIYQDVLGSDESLITHAYFKNVPTQISEPFFPDLVQGGDITVTVDNMRFDQPVTVRQDTFLLHILFDGGQLDDLEGPLIFNMHNHHTASDSFRNLDEFIAGNVFHDFPFVGADYVLGDIDPVFSGNGTDADPLRMSITFPYELFRSIEYNGQTAPDGLPAPQGFLEPFHFHFEYVVVPEPTTLALMLPGAALLLRRRRARLRTACN